MTYPCKTAIIDMLEAMGPQNRRDLRLECVEQAVPYSKDAFDTALYVLVDEGVLIVGHDIDGPYYDFPDSYYLKEAGFNV